MEESDCNRVNREIQGPKHHTHVTEHYYIRTIKLYVGGGGWGAGLQTAGGGERRPAGGGEGRDRGRDWVDGPRRHTNMQRPARIELPLISCGDRFLL